MNIVQMGCCAFNEIRALCSHASAPDAMRAFCASQLGTKFRKLKPGAFYVFTAVVKTRSAYDSSAEIPYGERFADFIKKNNLGKVIPTMQRVNRKNVPIHTVKGWIWAPSEKNLKEWWSKNGGASV